MASTATTARAEGEGGGRRRRPARQQKPTTDGAVARFRQVHFPFALFLLVFFLQAMPLFRAGRTGWGLAGWWSGESAGSDSLFVGFFFSPFPCPSYSISWLPYWRELVGSRKRSDLRSASLSLFFSSSFAILSGVGWAR
jgi:hypothetical protein